MVRRHVSALLGICGFHHVHLPIGIVDQSGDMFHWLGSWWNYLLEWLCPLGVHMVHQVVEGPAGVGQHICQDSYDTSSSVAMVKPGDTDTNQAIDAPLRVVLDQVSQALNEHFPSWYDHH